MRPVAASTSCENSFDMEKERGNASLMKTFRCCFAAVSVAFLNVSLLAQQPLIQIKAPGTPALRSLQGWDSTVVNTLGF